MCLIGWLRMCKRHITAVLSNFLLSPSLLPTRPRRQVSYNLEPLGINAPLREVLERKEPLALYHTNRKLTLEPKVTQEEEGYSRASSPAPPPALAKGEDSK